MPQVLHPLAVIKTYWELNFEKKNHLEGLVARMACNTSSREMVDIEMVGSFGRIGVLDKPTGSPASCHCLLAKYIV